MCFNPPPRRDCKGQPALCRGSGCPRKTSFSFFARRLRRRGREEENQGTPLDPGQERLPLTTRLGGRSKQRTFDRKVCFVSWRRDPIYLFRGVEGQCGPHLHPVGRDKSGPYDLSAGFKRLTENSYCATKRVISLIIS